MKPFKDVCGVVERKEYVRRSVNKRNGKVRETIVYPKLCENNIWFEPSLKPGIAVGRCSVQTHNPVYKEVQE